jgi:FMN-dependent oxidoreductase (nitrilotriacetate monooxygenase family)
LDHLSGGRAGWNVVTSSDAFTGDNFRRGGFLDHADRYRRAEEFVRLSRTLWDSWSPGDLVVDADAGTFVRTPTVGEFSHHGPQFNVSGQFNVPRSLQGHPVIIQAGDSDGGRELAASSADAVFSRHGTLAAGQEAYRDVKGRLARYGRRPDELKILPGVTFVLGDSPAEAKERAHFIRRQQVSPQTAILLLEQLWNADLSGYDPEGPLPDFDPDLSSTSIIQGRTRMFPDPLATTAQWRAIAEEKKLGIRDLIIEVTGRQSFVGTPAQVAEEMNAFVQTDAADGFILVPHLTPGGLDEFVDTVVPILQDKGVFRGEYRTSTLREHLGLSTTRESSNTATAAGSGVAA